MKDGVLVIKVGVATGVHVARRLKEEPAISNIMLFKTVMPLRN